MNKKAEKIDNLEDENKTQKRLEEITRLLNNLSSRKSNLKNEIRRKDYDKNLKEILTEMENLRTERRQLQPIKFTVTTITQEQINELDFDETMRAIASIQSKKTRSQYLENQEPYKQAIEIEQALLQHKSTLRPGFRNSISTAKLQELLIIAADKDVTKDKLIEMLQRIIELNKEL